MSAPFSYPMKKAGIPCGSRAEWPLLKLLTSARVCVWQRTALVRRTSTLSIPLLINSTLHIRAPRRKSAVGLFVATSPRPWQENSFLRACLISPRACLGGVFSALTALKILAIRQDACGFLPCRAKNPLANPYKSRY